MTEERALQQSMIRLAKRVDKLEEKIIELAGYMEYQKEKDTKLSNKVRKEQQKEVLKDIEYDTLKAYISKM